VTEVATATANPGGRNKEAGGGNGNLRRPAHLQTTLLHVLDSAVFGRLGAEEDEVAAEREATAAPPSGRAEIGRPLAWLLALSFLIIVFGMPAFDAVAELRRSRTSAAEERWPLGGRLIDLLRSPVRHATVPGSGPQAGLRGTLAAIQSAELAVEDAVGDRSVVGAWVFARLQEFLVGRLGAGSDEVLRGRDGWLFYRPAVDALMQRGFLAADWLTPPHERDERTAARRQRDPRRAIREFAGQLAARQIRLVLVPVPAKASIYPEMIGSAGDIAAPVRNPSFAALVDELARDGVMVFDPAPSLLAEKSRGGEPLYLATDTHWRPRAVEVVAERLAAFIRDGVALDAGTGPGYALEDAAASNLGDLAAMLGLSDGQALFPKETVTLHQVVTADDLLWRLDRRADVLLLGDSFANIYSLGGMGWGESAGLAEHLSYALGRPLDVILRNDDGAHATRLMLSQELSRGRDRLAGKRVVVWELSERELSFGDWRLIGMDAAPAPRRHLWTPPRGGSVVVSGTIVDMGVVPRPRGAPYADHVAAVHLGDLESTEADVGGREAVVFVRTMADYVLTPAAWWRVGQRVTLRVRPWADAGDDIQSMMRSELSDPELMFADPGWGEEVE